MRVYAREALRAAARELAKELRRTSAVWSDETAAAVNVYEGATFFEVRAGRPVGRWGWTPIQAYMLAANAKHPLFGNRRHWYAELKSGPAPFLDQAAQAGADRAMQAYADVAIPRLAAEYGYK